MKREHDSIFCKGGAAHYGDCDALAFAALGVGEVGCIKPVMSNGEKAFALHGADGHLLAIFADPEVAKILARQNELEPLSAH